MIYLHNHLFFIAALACIQNNEWATKSKACADPVSFTRGGPSLTTFFFGLIRTEKIQTALKVGHHRPSSETPYYASETVFHQRANDCQTSTLARWLCDFVWGSGPVLLRNRIFL